jgi:hypothetical protein
MAKRFYRVQTGDRPELAAIGSTSQLDVLGYAFPKIFPLLGVTEKSGTMSVAGTTLTNAQGTKDRADGTKLTGTKVAGVDVPWAAGRVEGRALMYEKDAAAYSSADAADKAGAEVSQRLAWNVVENTAFTKVFTAARASGASELADRAVIKTIQRAGKAVRAYGKPALVMTTNAWQDFINIPEVKWHLAGLAGAAHDIGFILSDVEKVRAAVSTFIGFDQIILFDSDIVGTDHDDKVAVIGLRRPSAGEDVIQLAKTKALYGFATVYIPEDAPADKPFDMRTWYDDDNKANVYDSEAYLGLSEAFADAVKLCKFAAEYSDYPVSVVRDDNGAEGGKGQ